MSDRRITSVQPGDRKLAELAMAVRKLKASSSGSSPASSGPTGGAATINFGATGTQEASIAVIGQTLIAAGSRIHAWFGGTTADNDVDAHLVASLYVGLTIESIVAGTGFTIRALNGSNAMTKTFNVYWMWF